MRQIHEWATAWHVPLHVVNDLLHRLGVGFDSPQNNPIVGMSETAVQNNARLEASKHGIILWRNNVGVLEDDTGRPVRYGLCNDTKELNERVKSADAVGINPIIITPAHVGHTIGQFVSREFKPGDWKYTGEGREPAQLKWIEIVTSKGGDASFCNGAGSFGTPYCIPKAPPPPPKG